jgi:hypothetical protein
VDRYLNPALGIVPSRDPFEGTATAGSRGMSPIASIRAGFGNPLAGLMPFSLDLGIPWEEN